MRVHAKICNAEARLVVAQFAHESGRPVPKYTERNGLYVTFLSAGFVEAARFGGGPAFRSSRTNPCYHHTTRSVSFARSGRSPRRGRSSVLLAMYGGTGLCSQSFEQLFDA